MRTVGFRKDKDSKIILPEFLTIPDISEIYLDNHQKEKLISYLELSDHVWAITLTVEDGEKVIGPYMIHTDGEWGWPSHLAYYVQNGDFRYLNKDFLNHIKDKKYEVERLSVDKKNQVLNIFLNTMLNCKKPKSFKP